MSDAGDIVNDRDLCPRLADAEAFVHAEGWRLEPSDLRNRLETDFRLDGDDVIRLVDDGANLRIDAAARRNGASPPGGDRALDGAAFILDAPADTDAETVWGGAEGRILWAAGEPLMIVAPQGVGKTTTGQRLALGRIGLCPNLLGFPVGRDERRVLYIAADRPRQARRSFARMVSEDDRDALHERLVIWPGPLPFTLSDPNSAPDQLARFCDHFDAGTLIIDSLKDVAVGLSSEETGGRIALALQSLVAGGVEVCALHHQRKAKPEAPAPKTLDDVYGSTWITSSCGSVLLLWGQPGDVLVELHHLKQLAEDVGPLTIEHDHIRGLPAVPEPVDLEDLLRQAGPEGLAVADAAKTVLGKANPSRNDIEKTRRRLNRLADNGTALHVPSTIPGEPGRYVLDGPAGDQA